MGTRCLSNYHMHIIYHLDEASDECVRRIVLISFLFLTKYWPVKSPRSEYDGLWKASSHISLIQQVQENWFHNLYAGNRVHVAIYKIGRCFCAMSLMAQKHLLVFFLTTIAGASSCPEGDLMKKQNKGKKRNVALQDLPLCLIKSWQ